MTTIAISGADSSVAANHTSQTLPCEIAWYDDRVAELYAMAQEDGVELDLKSTDSCREFLRGAGRHYARPAITAGAAGAVTATWGTPPQRHLGVRFLANGQIAYLLVPHEDLTRVQEWLSATTDRKTLPQILRQARECGIPA